VTVNSSVNNFTFNGTGSIGGAASFTKTGSSTLTLNIYNSYSGGTTINGGTLVAGISGALPAGGNVVNNANLSIKAKTTAGNVGGTGATTVAAGIAFSATGFSQSQLVDNGSATITGNGTVGLLSGAGSLTVGSASSNNTLSLAANGGVSSISALTIAAGSALNMNNNELIINYGAGSDPISTIDAYLTSGYNGGNWNGPGINTAVPTVVDNLDYSLGFADGADGIVAGLSSGQIEVKYTLVGDLNLDGVVDGIDFATVSRYVYRFDSNWDHGDLLYQGVINGLDLSDLVKNFGRTSSGGMITLSAADWAALDAFTADSGFTAELPEPASAGLLALAGAALAARCVGRKVFIPCRR